MKTKGAQERTPGNRALQVELAALRRQIAELEAGSERKFRRLVESSAEGVVLADEQGTIVEWNQAQEQITGLARAAVVGRPVWEVLLQLTPEGQKASGRYESPRANVLGMLRAGQASWLNQLYEREIQCPDGTRRWIQVLSFSIETEKGFMAGNTCRDITEHRRAEEALAREHILLRTVIDNLPDAIYVKDTAGRKVLANPAEVRFGGFHTEAEVLGKTDRELYTPEVVAHFSEEGQSVLQAGIPLLNHEELLVNAGGEQAWWLSSQLPLRDESGQITGLVGICRDITERKQAEDLVRREAARAEALARIAARLNTQLDLDKVLTVVCQETADALNAPATSVTLYDPDKDVFQIAKTFGLPAEFHERHVPPSPSAYERYAHQTRSLAIVPDVQATPDLPNLRLLADCGICTAVGASLVREGRLVGALAVYATGQPRSFSDDELSLLRGLADQAVLAIANARLYEEVRQQRAQLRALSARLVEVEETERKRLAQELHDQVGQNLTALGINLNILQTQLSTEEPNAGRSRLADSLGLVEQITERLRSVMDDLRSPVLDDYGLLACLRWYGTQLSSRLGIPIDVEGEELMPRPAASLENALFRIAQEALTNVASHAQATRASVVLELADGMVRLLIADDGIGFEPGNLVQAVDGHPRWGLLIMAERAEAAGGSCHIESHPGDGTRVIVEVPR